MIIGNEIYFKIASLPLENLDKPFFKRRSAYKLKKLTTYLEGLYALVDRYLAYACDFYENEYLSKYLNNVWSKELKEYNLNYRKLYSAMSGEYFAGVTYEQFKYCFESADRSLLQSKCANNKYGGIRHMIVKLRTVLPTWYEKVAETITDSNGNKYDKISLQRSVADWKVVLKELGYENTQFLIVRHSEKSNPHSHCVLNMVDNDGKRIKDHKEMKKGVAVCRDLTINRGYCWGDHKSVSQSKSERPYEIERQSMCKDIYGIIKGGTDAWTLKQEASKQQVKQSFRRTM